MRVPVAALAALSLAAAGCAPRSIEVAAVERDPAVYRNADCVYLAQEEARIRDAVIRYADLQNEDATRDELAAALGATIFLPFLLILTAGDEQEALRAMRGEHEAIRGAMARKGCTPLSIAVATPGQPPAYPGAHAPVALAEQIAEIPGPRPVEGAPYAAFTSEALRAYCAQPWEMRVGADGRTEYNPCHRRDAFL